MTAECAKSPIEEAMSHDDESAALAYQQELEHQEQDHATQRINEGHRASTLSGPEGYGVRQEGCHEPAFQE
ncbi:hypothetical protein G6F24_018431 [Rhizopus arrhizus]|nr:hypothetical protein G6F24_018431 [Rhizopus arrhizus]